MAVTPGFDRSKFPDDYPFMDKFYVNGVFYRVAWRAAIVAFDRRRRRGVEYRVSDVQPEPEPSIMAEWGWIA